MNPSGQHLLLECWGCPPEILSNLDQLQSGLQQAVLAAGATIVKTCLHRFAQGGVSGVIVLAESHLSLHTWPECGYAALDFFTCGTADPRRAQGLLIDLLKPTHWESLEIERGRRENPLQTCHHSSL